MFGVQDINNPFLHYFLDWGQQLLLIDVSHLLLQDFVCPASALPGFTVVKVSVVLPALPGLSEWLSFIATMARAAIITIKNTILVQGFLAVG